MNQGPIVCGKMECVLCGASLGEPAPRFSCPNCGLSAELLEDGSARAGGGETVPGYPSDGSAGTLAVEDESFWFAHRNRVILAMLGRFPFSGPLLDVGGGNGYPAKFLQESHPSLALVEPLAQACANSRKRGVMRVINGALNDLKLHDGAIGAACLLDVLEHIADPDRMLHEIYRILKPGGRLFITAPALNALWSAEDEYARHTRRYTRGSLRRQLDSAGFLVDYSSYYFGILVPPVLLMRALPYRLLGRKSTKVRREEHVPAGPFSRILAGFLAWEARFLAGGGVLPVGSSLICAARKA